SPARPAAVRLFQLLRRVRSSSRTCCTCIHGGSLVEWTAVFRVHRYCDTRDCDGFLYRAARATTRCPTARCSGPGCARPLNGYIVKRAPMTRDISTIRSELMGLEERDFDLGNVDAFGLERLRELCKELADHPTDLAAPAILSFIEK